MIVATLLVGAAFAIWSWVPWDSKAGSLLTVCPGMLLECFVFALVLWAISHGFAPFLDTLGVPLSVPAIDPVVGKVITFVGAGIYEEILFRLLLFSGLTCLLRLALVPKIGAIALAAIVSALVFAAAHHVRPY